MVRRLSLAVTVAIVAVAAVAQAQEVTRKPVLLQAVAPEYPPAALAAGKQADVPVRIHIDDSGLVTAVDVVTPVGDGFDEAAVAAAMQYIFEPAEIDGKPAAITVETVIHFVIEQQEEPDEPEPPPPPDEHPAQTWEDAPGEAGDPKQPIRLAGEVIERGTRKRLSGVIVSIEQLGLDVVSDADGAFAFHGVASGTYDVIALGDGYERLSRRVTIGKGERVDVRLWMHPVGGNPYETIVEGEREQLEVTKRTLQGRQLTTVPGTFGDPIRVIQTLPGVARAPFGLGVLLIRGSNPDDTGVFLDGHRIPVLFHFLGGPSILNAELVESIDLYPSGFPARFGRAHGGVVAIETKSSKSDRIHGDADVDLLDAGGSLRAPLGKHASFAFAGRRSYLDTFLPLFLPDQKPGAQLVVVPVYWDTQGRVDVDLGREGRASVFAIASSDRLDVLSKDPADEMDLGLTTAIRFFRVIGTYTRPLGGDFTFTLSPAWGRDTVSFASGTSDAQSPFLSLDIVQTALTSRLRVKGHLGARALLDAGLDLESRVTDFDALAPDDTDIRPSEGMDVPPTKIRQSTSTMGLGLHADLALDLGRLRLIPGLRLDGYVIEAAEKSSVDPRVTARFAATSQWTLKAYLGRFSQPPAPETASSLFGNPDIGIEHAIHVGAGTEWRPSRLWLLDTEAYYIDRRNLVGFTQRTTTNPDGTIDMPNFVNGGHGYTYGLEVMIKREISDRLYGWLSYTFSHGKRQTPDGPLALTGFDQMLVANMVASWRPGGGWELGARWQLASGRPDDPVIGSTYDADSGGYVPVEGPIRSSRIPFFNEIDARIEKIWLFDTWMLGGYLDVQNVINHKNVEAFQYDYRFRERAAVTGIPILPTIGIRGQW
jgi:TonB family protein